MENLYTQNPKPTVSPEEGKKTLTSVKSAPTMKKSFQIP